MKPVYIYVRHTPKMVRFFASEQVTPKGEKKRIIDRNHPMDNVTMSVIAMMQRVFQEENRRTFKRPTMQLVVTLAKQRLGDIPGYTVDFIPECRNYSGRARISRI